MGDVLGSCVFNLMILALIDIFHRPGSLYKEVGPGHVVSAGFGVILLAAAGLAMMIGAQGAMPAVGHISVASLLLLVVYLVAMRTIYVIEQHHPAHAKPAESPKLTLKAALMGYGTASIVIVGAGIWLPIIGVELAGLMGWTHSFVGTLFIAFATSVPELATTWGAVRIGALDMAVGNLLGSNLFDVVILAIDDVAYAAGPIYAGVSPVHAASAFAACLMSAIVIVSLASRPARRIAGIATWPSLALLALYLLNAAIQFSHG